MRSGLEFTVVMSATKQKKLFSGLIGASTFVGIQGLMKYKADPTSAVKEAIKGDSSKIDMSVADIYGGAYGSLGLPGDLIACSFGKVKDKTKEELEKVQIDDVLRSLLTMISTNAMLMSMLVAKKENITKVIWMGQHVDMPEYEYMCAYTMKLISKGEINLIFLKNSSYLTSMGLFLAHTDFCRYSPASCDQS